MSELEAELGRAMQLHASGRAEEAERAFRGILGRSPGEPNATHMLGVLLYQLGRMDEAERLLKESLAYADSVPQWHGNYAVFCRARGRVDEAMQHLLRAIQLDPASPEAYDNLGMLLADQNRVQEAAEAFEKAGQASSSYGLGDHHLAQHLWNRGMAAEAIARWEKAVAAQPGLADARGSLCFALDRIGQSSRALPHGRRAVELDPMNPDAHVALAIALGHLGRIDEGIAQLREALRLHPGHVAALINMGWLLEESKQHDEAADYSRMALAAQPREAQAVVNLGMSLINSGDSTEAIRCFRAAIEIERNHLPARSNLLWALHYDPELSPQTIFEEHRQVGALLKQSVPGDGFAFTNDRNTERPLRIAYLSPDFRRHPVASFIEPILRSHDRQRFVISCYSLVRSPDEITARIRAVPANWHDAAEWSDEELARKIHENQEDILIDLAGHTAGGRLRTLAMKPAPVQISYLGYVNTTGLSAVDYRMTDSLVDPPAASDSLYTERLLRIPCFFCYAAPKDAPAVGPLPMDSNGHVTFGSLNQVMKFNPRVLELWAKVLKQVDRSRLVLMCGTPRGTERIQKQMSEFGIAPDRLTLLPRQGFMEYLGAYNTIDLALDPFPASGHTTTCEALWMGVPVITRAGPGGAYVSRLSMDVLTQVGLTELVAGDSEQYLQIAAALASDRSRLRGLRQSLRQRLSESPMMDGPTITREIERAYRHVWSAWALSVTSR